MIHQEFTKGKVFSFNTEVEYASGSIVSKIILKKDTGNVTLFSFDKGQFLSEHTTPFDALIQVVDGEAAIDIGKETFHLKASECIIMPANIPHAVHATERFKMVLSMIKA